MTPREDQINGEHLSDTALDRDAGAGFRQSLSLSRIPEKDLNPLLGRGYLLHRTGGEHPTYVLPTCAQATS
jgi:hypothetical protein